MYINVILSCIKKIVFFGYDSITMILHIGFAKN